LHVSPAHPGREAPGKAYRLYTERTFFELSQSTPPELLRTQLGSVVLNLKAMGIGDLLEFDFLDSPPKAALVRWG
jgi:HrpA-like RNA helicase